MLIWVLTCIIQAVKFGVQFSGRKFYKKNTLKREHPAGATKIGFGRFVQFELDAPGGFALKGPNRIARGNAPGREYQKNKALKGRSNDSWELKIAFMEQLAYSLFGQAGSLRNQFFAEGDPAG